MKTTPGYRCQYSLRLPLSVLNQLRPLGSGWMLIAITRAKSRNEKAFDLDSIKTHKPFKELAGYIYSLVFIPSSESSLCPCMSSL